MKLVLLLIVLKFCRLQELAKKGNINVCVPLHTYLIQGKFFVLYLDPPT